VETVLNQKREVSSTPVPPAAGPAAGPAAPADVPPEEEEEDGGAEPGESSPVEGMEGWKLGAEYYGVQTHYKYDDEGLISVHIQGNEQELPVFEQMAVINEVDLYHEWVPFCSHSGIVDRVNPSELVAYFNINMKLLSRDGCIHAYGIDALQEHGMVLLIGSSVEEWPGHDIPFVSAGWLHQTMRIKAFHAIIEVLSPHSARTKIICTETPR